MMPVGTSRSVSGHLITTMATMALSRLKPFSKRSAVSSIGDNDVGLCPTARRNLGAVSTSAAANEDSNGAVWVAEMWRVSMKTILSALVALSFLAGVVAPASAAEPFSIKQLDAEGRGGHDR